MSQPSLPSPSSASSTRMPQVRPRVVLPGHISPHSPPMQFYNNNPLYITPGTNIQMTPGNGLGFVAGDPFGMYPTKASEFMFKQFSGFKDFTMNVANSGLSVGEKMAFWMYNKISSLSRRWFTHTFLLLVIAMYSVVGAFIFVAIEGKI